MVSQAVLGQQYNNNDKNKVLDMTFGGKNNSADMRNAIVAEIDGDSIQAAIEQALSESASATTGQGVKAAANTLADTKQTVDSMRQRSLGARKEENKQMDADNEKRIANVGKSWMTLLMGDEESNASQGPDPLGLARPDREAIAAKKEKGNKDKDTVGLMGRPKLRPASLTVNADSPLNVRNNNLGNILNSSKNKWKGQTNLDTEETFASFSSPELGVRALKKVIEANIKATSTIEEYVNRYASEPDERAHFRKTGSLLPHLKNYALVIAQSQGLDSEKAKIPTKTNMLEWIKATARAEGGEEALSYFTDDIIKAGLK